MNENVSLDEWVRRKRLDPAFREADDALEPAYQLARLRIQQGLTQKELAERAGTKQPSIARMESGASPASLDLLRRVAAALGACVEVRIVPASAGHHGGG